MVRMCDGTLVQKIINYDFESAEPVTETWAEYEKEDMSDLQLVEMNLVKVPYSIDGTGFTGVAVIEKYDPDTWEDELEKIRNRQEKLRTKGGTRIPVLTQEDTAEEETQQEADSVNENGGAVTEPEQAGYEVTANSALSEYLAVNMMNASPVISLADFPESSGPVLSAGCMGGSSVSESDDTGSYKCFHLREWKDARGHLRYRGGCDP